jgi:hypothetical protein
VFAFSGGKHKMKKMTVFFSLLVISIIMVSSAAAAYNTQATPTIIPITPSSPTSPVTPPSLTSPSTVATPSIATTPSVSSTPFIVTTPITPTTYSVPQSFDFGINYYNVYGSPDISATIIGSNEFDRGQKATLNIDFMNRGKLLGFKDVRTPKGANEIFAAQMEMKLESAIVDATGIVASLSADPDSPVEVKSISQQLGSIKSGQNSITPAKFDIEINKKAKAGEYNLYLNLSYDYQKNIQVTNANATAQTYDVNHWYGMMAQNQTLKIKVKSQADFEIVNTTGSLHPGGNSIIEITIKNTGENEARNVKAIVNPSDPLSTTDGMAFLSTITPGNMAVAKIKVKADSETIPKVYGIDTVLKYETPEGDIKYSDILQATVEVKDAGLFQKLFGWF